MKRIISVILAAMMLLMIAPTAAHGKRAESRAPYGYVEHEYDQLLAFMEQTNSAGVKNGTQLSSAYDPNDPETWATYAEAVSAMQSRQLDGVGFEFAAGYMGIDLDNVINEAGELNQLAADIVKELDSYTEYSPSKRGLHILVKTALEPVGKRNDEIGLEMYNNGRFFTVTGEVYGQAKPIQERTAQVKAIISKYLPDKPKQQEPNNTVGAYPVDESAAEIWEKMFSSKSGAEIRALYDGDLSGHSGDHSRADQALANHLAYWTNGDAVKMDAMFRQSGLMREKWNQRRGAQTYG